MVQRLESSLISMPTRCFTASKFLDESYCTMYCMGNQHTFSDVLSYMYLRPFFRIMCAPIHDPEAGLA